VWHPIRRSVPCSQGWGAFATPRRASATDPSEDRPQRRARTTAARQPCHLAPGPGASTIEHSPELSFPFSAYTRQGATYGGRYLTHLCASSGFLNLSTRCSPHRTPGLFHPSGTHGVLPSQRFSPTGRRTPLGWSAPLDVSSVEPVFRGLSVPVDPYSPNDPLGALSGRSSLRFTTSPGPWPPATDPPSRVLPSGAFSRFRVSVNRRCRASPETHRPS